MRLFIVCKCWVQDRHVEQIVIKYFICKNFLQVWLILFIFKRISFLCKNSFLIRTENVALSQARRNSAEYLVYRWHCGCVLQETRSILQKLSFEQDRSEKQTMFYFCFHHSCQFEGTILDSRKGAGCVLADHLTRAVEFHR